MTRDPSSPATASSSIAVLIVDDRAMNLTALEAVLDPLGYELVKALSGRQAVACASARDFAVILLDVHMADMDGFETAREIKLGRNGRTPIIFLTAEEDSLGNPLQGYAHGAVDFMTKPLVPEVVRTKVRVFVELFRARRELEHQAERFARREREARASASVAASYIARLRDIATALSEAGRAEVVAQVGCEKGVEASGARAGCVAVLDEGGDALSILSSTGFPDDSGYGAGAVVPLPTACPLTEAVRVRAPVTRESAALLRERPAGAPAAPAGDLAAPAGAGVTIALPLVADDAVLGALTLVFEGERSIGEDQAAFCHALAQMCGQALQRARLRKEERRSYESALLLSRLSKELASSLDYDDTLRRIARLLVPALADFCAVDVFTADGHLRRVVVEHTDPEKVALATELHAKYPPEPGAPVGLFAVVQSGRSELAPRITPELVEQAARDARHGELLRALGLRSYVIVPMKVRERVLGAISLVQAESGRAYSERDLQLMEEVGARVALALENATLYGELRALNETLEQRVHERTRELEEVNRELESFSYSVSHDLRTPIRHITSFAQLLEKRTQGSLDGNALELLRTITGAARRGSRLIDDLLAFSRMGRTSMKKSTVSLAELVQQVRADLEHEAQGRSIRWVVAGLPDVFADAALIRLALQNLLSNAIKYTRPTPEPVIEVSARAHEDGVEVTIKDNGVGFSMELSEKLFGVFQRLHPEDQFEGTGIGLANVRRIIGRHGGRVWAESAVGQGATFRFTLPHAGGASIAPSSEARRARSS